MSERYVVGGGTRLTISREPSVYSFGQPTVRIRFLVGDGTKEKPFKTVKREEPAASPIGQFLTSMLLEMEPTDGAQKEDKET